MDEYGIVIVTYQPNINELNLKIKKYAQDKKALIVIVNNGRKILEIQSKNVNYINLKENKGIAFAQNIGVNYLIKKGIRKAFLFDQDSSIPSNFFEKMMKEWKSIKDGDELIGALAPNIYDIKSKKILNTRYLVKGKLRKQIIKCGRIYNTIPISSGILIDTAAYKKIGGNRSEYFIDWVDFQFDLDIIRAGYHVYQTAEVRIDHQIGDAIKCKFLWKTIHPTNHSVLRNYYYFRNGILFMVKNNDFPFVKKFVINSLLKWYIYAFYEEKSHEKHKAQISGIKDALKIITEENIK